MRVWMFNVVRNCEKLWPFFSYCLFKYIFLETVLSSGLCEEWYGSRAFLSWFFSLFASDRCIIICNMILQHFWKMNGTLAYWHQVSFVTFLKNSWEVNASCSVSENASLETLEWVTVIVWSCLALNFDLGPVLYGAQPYTDISRARKISVLIPDSAQLGHAASLGQRADRRALERSIMSTLWLENVPLCVLVWVRVHLKFVQTFFPSGPGACRKRPILQEWKLCVCAHEKKVVSSGKCVAVSAWLSVCDWRNVWAYPDREKPNRDTHTCRGVCVWVCFKIIRYVWHTWADWWDVCVCVCFSGRSVVCFPYFWGERWPGESQQSTCWFMQLLVPSITPTTTTEAEFVLHYFWCMRVLAVESEVRINSPVLIYAAHGSLLQLYIKARH